MSLTGAVAITVTALATGAPLAGATVALSPGAMSGTTAANGTLSFKSVPIGGYTLSVARAGFAATTVPVGVSTAGPSNVTLALATNDASSDGMAIVLNSSLLAGYGAQVTLTPTVTAPDFPDGGGLTYKWTQTGGTPATLSATNTPNVSFTTLTLQSIKLEGNPNLNLNTVTGGVSGPLVPGRFGGMGISPDETGNYSFQLTVTDPFGHAVSAGATINATQPSTGLTNVPLGLPVFLQGDNINDAGVVTLADGGWAQTAWNWAMTSTPSGSGATLANPATQFPSFTPDKPGSYVLTESVAGKTLTVYAGLYDGVSGGGEAPGSGHDYQYQGCNLSCHTGSTQVPYQLGTAPPDMFPAWTATMHAGAFSDYIDGQIGQEFGSGCIQCHTVGSNQAKTVPTMGFDDVAKADNWSFPSPLVSGDNAAMVSNEPDLAKLANVQCENCHGPQGTSAHTTAAGAIARISVSNEVCASCHGDESFHTKGTQWKESPHANTSLAMSEGLASPAHCGRCHTAQGMVQYAQQLRNSTGQYSSSTPGYLTSDGNPATFTDGGVQTNVATTASLTNLGLVASQVEPQTCEACHDPHGSTGYPFQLRLYDALPAGLPNGQGAITGAGAGAICMACHNTRNGETDDSTASTLSATAALGRAGHDGPQTDVVYGVNAYFVPVSNPSPHLAVKDTCVGCHEAIPNAAEAALGQTTNHSFVTDLSICATCHGSSGVDGAALQADVKAQMLTMDKLIFAKMEKQLGAAVTANTSYTVAAQDTATGNYLCAAAGTGTPAFAFTAAPTSMTEPQPVQKWRTLGTGIWMVVPGLTGTSECTSSGALSGGTYGGTAPLSVSPGGVKSGGVNVFVANSILAKAMSNEALLHNDETWGIHNLPFTQTVIANTTTQLNTL